MKRIAALSLLLLLLLPACALALTGQDYGTFVSYYEDNITLINEQENRYLLPLLLSRRNSGKDDGRVYYEVNGDVLSVTVTVDIKNVIEKCVIRLTVPGSMTYGDSVYNDYVTQNYHCVAFQMAMDGNAEPIDRYPLVVAIRDGLQQGGGACAFIRGDYALTCTLSDGVMESVFTNAALVKDTPIPEASPEPVDVVDEDEHLG